MTVRVAAIWLIVISTSSIHAQSVEEDIDAFQTFFAQRFADTPLNAFSYGLSEPKLYAQEAFPQYSAEMERARSDWNTPFANGKSFADCFRTKPPANEYPYYDPQGDTVRTVEEDINACLQANGEGANPASDSERIVRLVAAYMERFSGQPIAVQVDQPRAVAWYKRGRQFFWAKRGQLNFSCADCHVQNAGRKFRSETLRAALGHTVGFPEYHIGRASSDNPWYTAHKRYAECNKKIRAKPYALQSDEYKALEFYQATMNTGIPLSAPSVHK